MQKETLEYVGIVVIYFSFMTLPMFLSVLTNTSFDFEVDPTFMNGILTGSSIAFGFWISLLKRQPQSRPKYAFMLAVTNVFFLMFTVFSIFLCAIGVIHSVVALLSVVTSFNFNVFSLLLTLISE